MTKLDLVATAEALLAEKRYDLVTNYRAGSSIEEMERADDGEWVRFDDVAAVLLAQHARDQQEKEAAEKNGRALIEAEAGYREQERVTLVRLSAALTDGRAQSWGEVIDAASTSRQEIARLREALADAKQQLVYWWETTGRCPCGALSDRPATHPHVLSCQTEAALTPIQEPQS